MTCWQTNSFSARADPSPTHPPLHPFMLPPIHIMKMELNPFLINAVAPTLGSSSPQLLSKGSILVVTITTLLLLCWVVDFKGFSAKVCKNSRQNSTRLDLIKSPYNSLATRSIRVRMHNFNRSQTSFDVMVSNPFFLAWCKK